jgi:hypothetical protein
MSSSRPFISLRCRKGGCRERKKESVRGGESMKNRVSDRETERGVESERVRGRGGKEGRGVR